jgi:uncharacterized protein
MMVGVDVWSQQTNARLMEQPWLETLMRWTGKSGDRRVTGTAATLAAMDAAGIEIALLSAWHGPQGPLVTNDEVAGMIAEAPGRFRGLATVDLNDPMGSVRALRRIVDGESFIGVRVVPWLWDLPPNDRRYYPIYATCVDLGVPFCTQIGHTGPLCRSEPGRPIPYLDDVLLDFPELVVIGGHVGFPWIDEVISLAHKYPNFYVDTSAYAVHRLPEQLVRFMRGIGRTRVMFGSNWPMIAPADCLAKLDDMSLDDEARAMFLGGNARRVFGI